MKTSRYFIFLSVAAILSACAEKECLDVKTGEMLSIEAFAPADDDSKTVLGNAGAILWDGLESINVFSGDYSSKFTSSGKLSRAATATFSGTINASSGTLHAIYPYSSKNDSYSFLPYVYYVLTVPDVQTATEGSFDKNAFPSVASADFGEAMHFKNVCGGFCFTLSSNKVTKVVFRGNNNERLAGKVLVQSYSEELEVTDSFDYIKTITLAPLSGTLKTGVKYYISILPTEFTKGYTVELWTAEGIHYDYVDNTQRTLGRATFGKVENIDSGLAAIVPGERVSVTGREYSVKLFSGDASLMNWTWSLSDESAAIILMELSFSSPNPSNQCTVIAKENAQFTLSAKSADGKHTASKDISVERQDLSANGTANCYIVPHESVYKFKTVKGNSSESVGSVSKAEVLWESYGGEVRPTVGSIINDVSYNDGYISFSTPVTLSNGNAVIAAEDASGTILWSWHIWVCEGYDPAANQQVYNNNAGTMMDRNLGATSAVPGKVGALGLLYQWGRKDPFPGSSYIYFNSPASSTLSSWPTTNSTSSTGTIDFSVKHPTTFITTNSLNADWFYTGSSSSDDTRWNSSKGLYDPCPTGWKVPDGNSSGVWSKAFGTGSDWTTSSNWDSEHYGMDFGTTDKKLGSGTIWYPASGYLSDSNGSLLAVGYGGYYWACTRYGIYANCFSIVSDGLVGPNRHSYSRAYGRSVRCLSE